MKMLLLGSMHLRWARPNGINARADNKRARLLVPFVILQNRFTTGPEHSYLISKPPTGRPLHRKAEGALFYEDGVPR